MLSITHDVRATTKFVIESTKTMRKNSVIPVLIELHQMTSTFDTLLLTVDVVPAKLYILS